MKGAISSGRSPNWRADRPPSSMTASCIRSCRTDIETPTEAELVVCVNAETGEEIWGNRLNFFLSEVPDTRAGWSNIVVDPDTGNVLRAGRE